MAAIDPNSAWLDINSSVITQYVAPIVPSDYETVVQQLYVAYFGRPADYVGLQNFEAVFHAAGAPTTLAEMQTAYQFNSTVKALVDGFGSSAESLALYGSGNTVQFVTHIYESVLGRNPDIDGLIYWATAIDSGQLSRGRVALSIASAVTTQVGTQDAVVFANKIEAATLFTREMDTALEVSAYTGLAASSVARDLLVQVTLNPVTTAAVNAALQSVLDLANPPAATPDPDPAPSSPSESWSDTGPWTPPPPGDPFWG